MKQFSSLLESKALFRKENPDERKVLKRHQEEYVRDKGLNCEKVSYRKCYPVSYEELSPTFGILTIRHYLSDVIEAFCTTSEIAKKAMAMRKSDVPVWVGIIVTDEDTMPGIFHLFTHDEQMEDLLSLAQEEV